MPEAFPINSDNALQAGLVRVQELYDRHKYVTLSFRIGEDRSLDQNGLLHVWLTEYAAHLLKKDKRQVTPGELDGMKRHAKGQFHAAHPDCNIWMIHTVLNPVTGETKRDYTSSAKWKRGELTFFLDWLARIAAGDGLVLEAKGQYKKLKQEQNQ